MSDSLHAVVGTCHKRMWSGWHDYRCSRKEWKDGLCKQHHPDTGKKRDADRKKHYEEKRKQSPYYKLEQALKRIAALEAENAALRSSNASGREQRLVGDDT